MAQVTKIHTGFLSGNLFQDPGYDEVASADNYAALLHTVLTDAYPDVEIEVVYQRASGATPYDCKTQIYFENDETDDEEEARILTHLDQLAGDIYTDRFHDWAVEE